MKKRNKYWERDKEYRRLQNELYANDKAQAALGYVELKEPIPNGFTGYFVLRSDIANRDDAWIFQGILDLYGRSAWRRKNDFETVKERRTTPRDQGDIYWNYPRFVSINEEEFSKIHIQAKKWFTQNIDKWGRITYYSNVPSFFYEVEVEQHYKTHVKVIDEVLIQEAAYLNDKMNEFRNHPDQRRGHAPADYVRFFNVSHRREEKQVLHRMITQEKYDLCFPIPGRHTAQWAWF